MEHWGLNSRSHTLILGLQLTQFPGRKGRWNRKVARSAEKYCLTKVYAHLQLTTRRWRNERRGSSAEKGFGRYRARTMNQKMEKWSHSFLKNSRRYTVERPPLHQHRLAPSSLDARCQWCPIPLRVENSWKQSVIHTLSRFAALWRKDLNRHQKSLRKERKKSRKSSAKRAGERDRSSEK